MRKILILGASLVMASASFAAEVQPIEKVYDVPNLTKAQIYTGARTWFAESFKSAQDVIQMDDKESGTIIGKGRAAYQCKGMGDCLLYNAANVSFTLRVDTKDNKLRATYSNVKLMDAATTNSYTGYRPESEAFLQKKQVENITTQLTSLADQMVEKVKTNQTTSNDW